MSFGSDFGNRSGRLLASEADREAAQAALKTAFEEERLTMADLVRRSRNPVSVDLLSQRRSGHHVSLELLCPNGKVQGAEQR